MEKIKITTVINKKLIHKKVRNYKMNEFNINKK